MNDSYRSSFSFGMQSSSKSLGNTILARKLLLDFGSGEPKLLIVLGLMILVFVTEILEGICGLDIRICVGDSISQDPSKSTLVLGWQDGDCSLDLNWIGLGPNLFGKLCKLESNRLDLKLILSFSLFESFFSFLNLNWVSNKSLLNARVSFLSLILG